MLGSVAMLLSLFMHPIVAVVVTFFAGNDFYSAPNPPYFILPSHSAVGVFFDVLRGTLIDRKDVALLLLYAFECVAIMSLLAIWRFGRSNSGSSPCRGGRSVTAGVAARH